MDESYKQYEPVFGVWKIKRLIGEGSFGKVYEIEREDFGRTYKAALKIITIPSSQSEVKSIKADGMDDDSVTSYFRSFVEEVVDEFALMSKLKGNSNIVSYEDHMVIEHPDEIRWDILIRMELLTPLTDYTTENGMTRREIIQLGIDICKALELCQKYNIIHRDIKPENIFVSENGDYKLGDFGIARTIEKTTNGLSKKGTYTYMAPEVYKGEAYGSSVDLYSLGLVMYRLLNNNRVPFLPAYPEPITYSDRETAMTKRLSGAALPKPANDDGRLSEIILKACAYSPKDRYSSPMQMRMELEAILYEQSEGKIIYPSGDKMPLEISTKKPSGTDVVSGFSNIEDSDKTQSLFTAGKIDTSNDDKTESAFIAAPVTVSDKKTTKKAEPKIDSAPAPQNKKSNKGIIFAAVAVLAIALIAFIGIGGQQKVEDIHLSAATLDLVVGDSYQLEANIEPEIEEAIIEWASNNEEVITVQDGLLVAHKSGSADVTASCESVNAVCTVIVTNPVQKVALSQNSATIVEGETLELKATIEPADADDTVVIWTSSDENIATVNNGVVTAVSVGDAIITAECGELKSECTVSVVSKVISVEKVSLDKTNLTISKGGSATLKATVYPSDATEKNVVWKSSNTAIATVENGKIKAYNDGTAIIYAIVGGKTVQCNISVKTVWSEWSVEKPANDSQYESKTQYRYRDKNKETIQSENSYLNGWEKYNAQKEYGEWSDWADSYVSETDSREVETREILLSDGHTEYRYGHYKGATSNWCPDYGASLHGGTYTREYTSWMTTPYVYTGHDATCGYSSSSHNHYGVHHEEAGKSWWRIYSPDGRFNDNWSGGPYYYWEETRWVEPVYRTQYRYRIIEDVYYYYRYVYGDWSTWGDTVYSETDTRDVQRRTVYRSLVTG